MQLAQIFFDVHMGKNFQGLIDVCRKAKVDSKNQYVVFMNSKKTKFKILMSEKYLVYHDNKDSMIDLNSLRHLPAAFNGNKPFDFSKAVEGAINEKFYSDGRKK